MADGVETAAKASNPSAISVRLKHYNADRTKFQIDHDLRRGKQPSYVDGDRSHLNSGEAGPKAAGYRELMLDRRALTNPKRAPMMDRVAVMTGGIVTFGHLAQLRVLELAPDRQDAMFQEIAAAVAERLGNELTSWAVHRDEESPHAHFQMPARRAGDGKLMSEVLKPSITSELQDLAASVAQRYAPGIQRGERKAITGARNKSVRGLHRTGAVDQAKREKTLAALDVAIAARTVELDAAEARLAKNERLAARAWEKAEGEGARAEKAAENAERYEGRAEAARGEAGRLTAEIARLEERKIDVQARVDMAERTLERLHDDVEDLRFREEGLEATVGLLLAQVNDLDASVAQKKTRIASLATRRLALQAKSQRLSAA